MTAVTVFIFGSLLSVSVADEMTLKIGDGSEWSMPAGAWLDDEAGQTQFNSPGGPVDEALAFYKPRAWRNVEVECDFKLLPGHGDAGLVLRAQDAQNYYVVHFPLCGQAYRARNFWVAVSKVDNAHGWTRCLRLAALPGVNSAVDLWHHVRVTMVADEIRVWVDGRAFEPVRDATFKEPGRVGLMGFCQPVFRNIVVRGQLENATTWNEDIKPGRNWFTIYPTGGWQRMCSMTRAPNGNLLMLIPSPGKPPVLVDSADNGRTWQLLTELPPAFLQPGNNAHGGVLQATHDQRLMLFLTDHKTMRISRAESQDSGKSWSAFQETQITGLPGDLTHFYPYNPMVESRDGTLLWPAYAERFGTLSETEIDAVNGNMSRYLPYAAKRFGCVLRLTDGGQSWSVSSMHGPSDEARMPWPMNPPEDGACEANIAQLTSGELVAYVRPEVAATMWETRSNDDGQTWSSWTRSAVPGWAAALVRTEDDSLLLGHRMPGNCVHLSRDGGLNWDQGTRVETSLWSQGVMMEVEPNVVLYVYMDSWQTSLRGQFLRVTDDGLEPLPR